MAIGQVMLTLFAIVVVGYIAGKWGYMGGTFDKKLSKVVIDITCPALILSSANYLTAVISCRCWASASSLISF